MKKSTIVIFVISFISCNSLKKRKTDYEINKEETFEVVLKSNPTTGFSWKWIKETTSKRVDSLNVSYIEDKSKAGMTGVGGNEIWKFKGSKKGLDTLTFEYCRPWDPKSTVETKKIIIKIK